MRSMYHTGGNEKAKKDNKDEDDILFDPELEEFKEVLTDKMEQELLATQADNTSTPIRLRKSSTGSKRSDRDSSGSPESEEKIRRKLLEGLSEVD